MKQWKDWEKLIIKELEETERLGLSLTDLTKRLNADASNLIKYTKKMVNENKLVRYRVGRSILYLLPETAGLDKSPNNH